MNPLHAQKVFAALINPKILCGAVMFDFLGQIILPGAGLFFWLLLAMLFDLCTGILKAVLIKEKFSSKKMRDSVSKVIQYFGAIFIVIVVTNAAIPKYKEEISIAVNGVYSLLILIEIVSMVENLRAMAPNSQVSQHVFTPLLKLLRLKKSQAATKLSGGETE